MELFEKSFVIYFFVLLGSIAVANCADIRCYDGSFENYEVFSLDDPVPILKAPCFRFERKTVFFIFGFNGVPTEPSAKRIINVYLNKTNILLLNWDKEAAAVLGFISYLGAVVNVARIGKQFGNTLITLSNNGLSLSDVHLIGFSLGAQLAGYSGNEVIRQGKIIKRITCCDAAGPFYDGVISLPRVNASAAEYVYSIHTNPGVLGSKENVSTADFWVNCGSNVQPSCEAEAPGTIVTFVENLCSHERSWDFFAESVERPTAFQAQSASSCEAWNNGEGTNQIVYLGDNIDSNARGNYYLRTNSTSPYGLGEEGSQPASE